jgi:hypothetical protein
LVPLSCSLEIAGTVITSCFQLALQEFLQQQHPRRAQSMVLIKLCVFGMVPAIYRAMAKLKTVSITTEYLGGPEKGITLF